AAGKTGQHLVVVQAPDLAGIALEHGIAHRYLAVAGDGDLATVAHAQNGGSLKLLQSCSADAAANHAPGRRCNCGLVASGTAGIGAGRGRIQPLWVTAPPALVLFAVIVV